MNEMKTVTYQMHSWENSQTKRHFILVSLVILSTLIISVISITLYTKMENRQETLNNEIQILTQRLQNLANFTSENQIKVSMQDQLQKNYTEKLQQYQNKQNQIAFEYNDSRANFTQQITHSKIQISTLAENQQKLSQTIEHLVQEQSILRHLNSSELSETLIKVENLKHAAFLEVGWFTAWNGYKYRVTNSSGNWWNTRRECQSYGGDLAAPGIRNMNVRRFIKSFISEDYLWIGLNDIHHEGRFVWIDGVNGTAENMNWQSGEPNNLGTGEDCAIIAGGRDAIQLNDSWCNRTASSVTKSSFFGLCEKPLNKLG